jgi:hypothetical protein
LWHDELLAGARGRLGSERPIRLTPSAHGEGTDQSQHVLQNENRIDWADAPVARNVARHPPLVIERDEPEDGLQHHHRIAHRNRASRIAELLRLDLHGIASRSLPLEPAGGVGLHAIREGGVCSDDHRGHRGRAAVIAHLAADIE